MLLTLHVHNMEKSLAFYSTLMGLSILRRQPTGEGREMVFLGKDEVSCLELISSDTATAYTGFSIGFSVDDLVVTKERLAQHGYTIEQEFSPSPDTTLCFFDGPNGEKIELIASKTFR